MKRPLEGQPVDQDAPEAANGVHTTEVAQVGPDKDQMTHQIEIIKRWIFNRSVKVKACKVAAWDWVCKDLGLENPPSRNKKPYMDALDAYVSDENTHVILNG